jgi:hypothetical protein
MTPTNGGNGNGGSGGGNEAAREYFLLGFIQANFKATPPSVPPFGSTTLSWNAQIPTTLRVPVTLIFEGQPVNHARQPSRNSPGDDPILSHSED